MKILLQHTRTLLFLRTRETWTRSDFEARDFQHSQKAIEFAHGNNLQDVQIAIVLGGGDENVVAPVPPRLQATAHAPMHAAA